MILSTYFVFLIIIHEDGKSKCIIFLFAKSIIFGLVMLLSTQRRAKFLITSPSELPKYGINCRNTSLCVSSTLTEITSVFITYVYVCKQFIFFPPYYHFQIPTVTDI